MKSIKNVTKTNFQLVSSISPAVVRLFERPSISLEQRRLSSPQIPVNVDSPANGEGEVRCG